MSNRSDGNVHALEFREAKPSQGNPSRPVADLFRIDDQTVISESPTILHAVADTYCVSYSHWRNWFLRHNAGYRNNGEWRRRGLSRFVAQPGRCQLGSVILSPKFVLGIIIS